jgi:hypothetical protein
VKGLTTAGRVHFTRTLDRELRDPSSYAAAAKRAGRLKQLEAISTSTAVAGPRTDDGRFDGVSVKSVAHLALAEACRRVKLKRAVVVD